MKFLLSPAKKMNRDTDSLPWQDLPRFLPQAEQLWQAMGQMDAAALKALWKCNDRIAEQNVQRLRTGSLRTGLTPAILAYEGIAFQYMAPSVFTAEQFDYVQAHLRILSGLYGVLRPFDGVTPYRLEMQARLSVGGAKDLYAFWGDRLAAALWAETDCIVNLASQEYSRCVSRFPVAGKRFITCVFGEEKDGKVVEKGTLCKMARGEMVRFAAEKAVTRPEQLQEFHRHYRFVPERSTETEYVFLRTGEWLA